MNQLVGDGFDIRLSFSTRRFALGQAQHAGGVHLPLQGKMPGHVAPIRCHGTANVIGDPVLPGDRPDELAFTDGLPDLGDQEPVRWRGSINPLFWNSSNYQ